MVNIKGAITKPLSNWKLVAFVVAGALITGIVSAFLPIHPIISQLVVSFGLGLINPMLAVGGLVGLVMSFLGALPKPGKTEGTQAVEAI